MKVDIVKFLNIFNNMKGKVGYSLGAKAESMTQDSHDIKEIDCSGFIRFALYKSVSDLKGLPDGSVQIHSWCKQQGFYKLNSYHDIVHTVKDPNRLFLAFLEPSGGHPGHIWTIYMGKTQESHGGVGVSSRPWDSKVLLNASECFELPLTD